MEYSLAPFIHYALFGSRAVILDTRRDRYRLLGAAGAEALADMVLGRDPSASVAAKLVEAGILQAGKGRKCYAGAPDVRKSAAETHCVSATTMSAWRVAWTLASTMRRLKVSGLQSALDHLDDRRTRQAYSDTPNGSCAAVAVAQAYDRARAFVPIARICLRDSICLYQLLTEQRRRALLVLGVRLDPFQAHAWVQAGDVLLSDRLDAVTPFTPILTL